MLQPKIVHEDNSFRQALRQLALKFVPADIGPFVRGFVFKAIDNMSEEDLTAAKNEIRRLLEL